MLSQISYTRHRHPACWTDQQVSKQNGRVVSDQDPCFPFLVSLASITHQKPTACAKVSVRSLCCSWAALHYQCPPHYGLCYMTSVSYWDHTVRTFISSPGTAVTCSKKVHVLHSGMSTILPPVSQTSWHALLVYSKCLLTLSLHEPAFLCHLTTVFQKIVSF